MVVKEASGTRLTNSVLIDFEILWFKMYTTDHNEISLRSIENFLN